MTVENFVQIVWIVFGKIKKSFKNAVFGHFELNLAMFLPSQPYDFDAIAYIGLYYDVERLQKISFESYGQFLRKSKNVEKSLFFGHFWPKFGYVSHIPVIQFDAYTHAGALLSV